MEFGVLGGGRWGTALGLHLSRMGHRVLIYDVNPEPVRLINSGKHPYIDGVDLPASVKATTNIKDLEDFRFLVCALPTQVVGEVLSQLDLKGKVVINASKGLEKETFRRVSEIVRDLEPKAEVLALSGPSFAQEVSRGLPTAVVLGYEKDRTLAETVRNAFNSESFRVYLNDDLTGVELGGALKNVIAIACGISDGLGFGHNARAALITRGLVEITRIGVRLGARRETFFGLSGAGDLILTATSDLSRNRTFGLLIGKGLRPDEALRRIGQTVEGVETVKALKPLTEREGIYAPITNAVYEVVVEGRDLKEVLREMLLRTPGEEFSP